MTCNHCVEWGRTITRVDHPCAIACPECKRLTYPNLGVNCPAGAAVAFAMGYCIGYCISQLLAVEHTSGIRLEDVYEEMLAKRKEKDDKTGATGTAQEHAE